MIKIQIIRTLPFTMSFLGFMYLDRLLTLTKKWGQACPWFWHSSAKSGKMWLGSNLVFQWCFFALFLGITFLAGRGLEKPLTAVSSSRVLMPGISKLRVPTLWLWWLAVSSHRSESQGSQGREPGEKKSFAVYQSYNSSMVTPTVSYVSCDPQLHPSS